MTTPVYRWPWDKLSVGGAGLSLAIKQALSDPPTSDQFRAQVLSNGRWQTTFSLPTNNYLDTGRARNIQLQVNGYANRFKVPDFMRLTPNGSIGVSFAELISNPYFANGTVGYTFQNNDGARTRVLTLQKLKLAANGAAAVGMDYALAVTANTQYVFRVYGEIGTLPSFTIGAGTAAFARDIAVSAAQAVDGYVELPFNSGANITVHLNVLGAAGASTQYILISYFSVQQCLQVNGAGQSGGLLNVKSGKASQLNFLQAGDLIEISNHVYEVVSDADTTGGGLATLEVAPILRSSPADGQAIITNNCAAICLMKSPMTYPYQPGRFGSFSFEAWEDLSL